MIRRRVPIKRSTKPIRRTPIKATVKKKPATKMGDTKKMSTRTTTPEKRADTAFSKALRLERGHCQDDRPGHNAEAPGVPWFSKCKGRLELCHGHERWHRATRYDERNVWVMCQGAHFWYTMHPLVWDECMRRWMGEDSYDDVRIKALNRSGTVRHDYAAITAHYNLRAKAAARG